MYFWCVHGRTWAIHFLTLPSWLSPWGSHFFLMQKMAVHFATLLYTIQLNFWFEDFFGILCAGFGLGTEHREMKMAQCLSLRSSAQTRLQTQILSGAAMQHDTSEYGKDWGQLEMLQLDGINNKNSCHVTRTPLWAGLSLALFCNSWTSYMLISWPIAYFLCDFSY